MVSDVLGQSWRAAYDPILGADLSERLRRKLCNSWIIGLTLALASRDPSAHRYLCAVRGDQLVGYSSASLDQRGIVLWALYVDPDCQRTGIGTALLEAVVAEYPGAPSIRLEVLEANTTAIAWYESKGFVRWGATPNATGTKDVPAIYMDKQL